MGATALRNTSVDRPDCVSEQKPDLITFKSDSNMATPSKSKPSSSQEQGSQLFLFLLMFNSCLGGFLFGYDTGVISGALVLMKKPDVFNLSSVQSESVVSVAVGGAIVGAMMSSYCNELYGRKPVILLSSVLFAIGSVILAVANSFAVLVIGRIVVGLGLGFSSMTVPLYIAEVAPSRNRGRLIAMSIAFVTGGQFIAAVIAALLSKTDEGWRYMLGIAAAPAIFQFFGFLMLPESPRYLASKGKREEALVALAKIRGTSNVEAEYNVVEHDVITHAREARENNKKAWHDLYNEPTVRRALILGCVLQALQQFCGINTVMYYGATIMEMAGFSDASTAIWLSAVVAFSNFLFTFVGLYLVDRLGRRLLTLGSLIGISLSLIALGLSFYIANEKSAEVVGVGSCSGITTCFTCVADSDCGLCTETVGSVVTKLCVPGNSTASDSCLVSGDDWSYESCPGDSSAPGIAIVVILFIYIACFASGMGSTPWTINAEIYPLHVRSMALSMSTVANWIANLVMSYTFLSLVDGLQTYGAFWFYAGISVLGFVYLLKSLPETKGLKLEDIQQLFDRNGKYGTIESEV